MSRKPERFDIKSEKDIKAIADRDCLYSTAISPITPFIVLFFAIFGIAFVKDRFILGAISAIVPLLSMVFVWGIHHICYWNRFGPNWRLCQTCTLNGTKYYVVKDGARRYRVYYIEGNMALEISGPYETDHIFVQWLKNEKPEMERQEESQKPNWSLGL